MSAFQILALCVAGGVALTYLLPLISFGTKEQPLMVHLRNIIAVRDQFHSPDVTAACNALIQTLLGTNK